MYRDDPHSLYSFQVNCWQSSLHVLLVPKQRQLVLDKHITRQSSRRRLFPLSSGFSPHDSPGSVYRVYLHPLLFQYMWAPYFSVCWPEKPKVCRSPAVWALIIDSFHTCACTKALWWPSRHPFPPANIHSFAFLSWDANCSRSSLWQLSSKEASIFTELAF